MLSQQKDAVKKLIERALIHLGVSDFNVSLEHPKDPSHGDLACTSALQLARTLKKAPREIASMLIQEIEKDPEFHQLIAKVEIAGPGFINIRVSQDQFSNIVRHVLQEGAQYGDAKTYEGQSILLEFVSANPTGPLHLGHARQGALGDVLARIFASQGYQVSREFYYNDAGVQIGNLAKSVQIRALQQQGQSIELPEDAYHGEYIQSIAQDYLNKISVQTHDGQIITSQGDVNDLDAIRRYAVAYLRNEQDADLKALGVAFDNYFLESSLYSSGALDKAVQAMIDSGYTYEADHALWLKTTAFDDLGQGISDDKDRVMRKADGTYTYFVPDVAYHLNKFSRGFTRAINIQGTDHHGTIARVRAGLQAASKVLNLSIPTLFPEYILHKMLSVVKDGAPVKMSKRSGNYVTLRDLVDWAGQDAARYFLVERKADAEFVFDVTLAQQKSDENPVYYLQYAHARICSVLNQLKERGYTVPTNETGATFKLETLQSEAAQKLITVIGQFPETLQVAAREQAPHHLCHYLKYLASAMHTFYNAERVIVDNEVERNDRVSLLLAVKQVLLNGFALLGISAPEQMQRREESEN